MYKKWHGKGRNLYAVTPRFAPGVTTELLAKAGHLFKTLPGVYMNTHLAEVIADLETVKKLFPNATDYYSEWGVAGKGEGGPGWLLGLLVPPSPFRAAQRRPSAPHSAAHPTHTAPARPFRHAQMCSRCTALSVRAPPLATASTSVTVSSSA